jgi:hypothetical protein
MCSIHLHPKANLLSKMATEVRCVCVPFNRAERCAEVSVSIDDLLSQRCVQLSPQQDTSARHIIIHASFVRDATNTNMYLADSSDIEEVQGVAYVYAEDSFNQFVDYTLAEFESDFQI